jgi:hypothetical protein
MKISFFKNGKMTILKKTRWLTGSRVHLEMKRSIVFCWLFLSYQDDTAIQTPLKSKCIFYVLRTGN